MRRTKVFSLLLVIILLSGGLRDTSTAVGAPPNEPPTRLVLADLIPPAMTALAVEGDYAYVGTYTYMVVIDISNPDRPSQVAYAQLSAPARQVVTAWGRVYVLTDADQYELYPSSGDESVAIFDVRNPTAPKLIGQISQGAYYSLDVQGFTLYLSSEEGFSILDVSDPRYPVTQGFIPIRFSLYGSAVSVSGSQALLASYSTLWVINIADPLHPTIIGELEDDSGLVRGSSIALAFKGNLVAMAGGFADGYYNPTSDCILIDLSDLIHPTKLSQVGDSYGSHPSVVLLNQRMYFSGRDEPVRVYDIRDPKAPVLLGEGDDPVWGLASTGNLIYSAAGEMGFVIYDDQGPAVPQKRGSILGINTAEDIAVQGDYQYIADGGAAGNAEYSTDYIDGGFATTKIYSNGHVQVVGRNLPNDQPSGFYAGHGTYVAVQGDQAFLTGGSCYLRYTNCRQSLFIVDVTQPEAPALLGTFELGLNPDLPYAGPVIVQNQTAYIVDVWYPNGLAIVDVSQPVTPTLLDVYTPPLPSQGSYVINGVAITGTYGLVTTLTNFNSTTHESLQVIDVSDPVSPTLLRDYPMKYPTGVFVEGSKGFVAVRAPDAQSTANTMLRVLDLSGLPQVQVLSDIDLPGQIYDVAYDGRYAYVADGQAGLRMIDLSDPSNPLEVLAYDTPGNAVAVAQEGEWVYLADQDGGLLVFRKVRNFVYLPVVNLTGESRE